MRNKAKRITAAALTGVMALGLLAGCGSSGSGSGSDSGEQVTIRLLTRMSGTSPQVGIWNDILDEFKEKHPEVTIIDDSQSDESAYNNVLSTDIASGEMANIFRIQGVANLGEYIDNGMILDLQPYLDEDPEWGGGFTESSLAYYQVPGYEGTYAVPAESGVIGFYYNTELFEKAGISEFPETWTEFLDVIDKLNAIDVTPIAIGTQSTYMAGHLHNLISYRWLGTDIAKQLGSREKKWTDSDVVETLQYVKDLIDANAFDPNCAGLTDTMALTSFQTGEAAMIITGPWNISVFSDPEQTAVYDKIAFAKFPYFEEKPEYKDEDMQTMSPYMVSGKLEGEELDLTLELLKMLTGPEATKRFAEESATLIPRTDVELDQSKINPLLSDVIAEGNKSTGIAQDIFDYDPLTSMQDRTRNSIASMFTGATPEDAAAEIQAEIDSNQ
ncbi:MAG TPA: extracellular solute-binding protein [Candidatus Mediterraneibacter excrementigallinarum]|nr:extracellular solute-binding protein [Candidatus Mediterraneibacter excrementigallinarum]HJD45815.1 extracellular solute-binding protein [Candidatus Mediterraneibacter norfolkensis]